MHGRSQLWTRVERGTVVGEGPISAGRALRSCLLGSVGCRCVQKAWVDFTQGRAEIWLWRVGVEAGRH